MGAQTDNLSRMTHVGSVKDDSSDSRSSLTRDNGIDAPADPCKTQKADSDKDAPAAGQALPLNSALEDLLVQLFTESVKQNPTEARKNPTEACPNQRCEGSSPEVNQPATKQVQTGNSESLSATIEEEDCQSDDSADSADSQDIPLSSVIQTLKELNSTRSSRTIGGVNVGVPTRISTTSLRSSQRGTIDDVAVLNELAKGPELSDSSSDDESPPSHKFQPNPRI
eukprot:gnl/MRDRNA2_/MRDRNA2_96998_c0_seq1.p1 gnl/MRDRNA2_/MRDRNA2_96998_c0~~gnl/MRDRNA2_/MRDRNA2_96998_c0_seq1.p1  ORF type:complete len:225 (-),score=37.30 gnl/MRDRNA2_/MRDRNA2_96998_c0_seq1:56-730(-)